MYPLTSQREQHGQTQPTFVAQRNRVTNTPKIPPFFTVPVVGDYNVLDTDYEGYASVYSCQALLGLGHVEQAWILARTPALEQNKIDAAAAAFTNFGIDVNQFMATPQENCVFP